MWKKWLNDLRQALGLNSESSKPRKKRAQLSVETLEDRRVPAVLTVNSIADDVTADDGLVTRREAIAAANDDAQTDLGDQASGADTIVFDADVFGTPQTINLGEQLSITSELTIQGTGSDQLTIDAQQNSRSFLVSSDGISTISGLTITNGASGNGGGIRNEGTLTVQDSIITRNVVSGSNAGNDGGAIFNSGSLTVERSTLSDNQVTGRFGDGGAIEGRPNSVTVIRESTLSGNFAKDDGGAIETYGQLTIIDSTISGNTAEDGGGGVRLSATGGRNATVEIVNTTISGNQGGSGGGFQISNPGNSLALRNSTITGNISGGGGG